MIHVDEKERRDINDLIILEHVSSGNEIERDIMYRAKVGISRR